jgi:hypothetical protein
VNEEESTEYVFERHVARDVGGDTGRDSVETRFILALDLGEPEFEEDIQTHHTSYAGGYSTVNAVGDPRPGGEQVEEEDAEETWGVGC